MFKTKQPFGELFSRNNINNAKTNKIQLTGDDDSQSDSTRETNTGETSLLKSQNNLINSPVIK